MTLQTFARHGWLDVIGRRRRPDVSVVVVVYNIPREAERTLRSLSAAYQRHIAADDYEVIVVDNGSTPPFDRKVIERLPGNFRLIRIDRAPPSPAKAINRGLVAARGKVIGVMIDGARIATPGLLHFARHGARLFERSVVATLGWHLGFDTSQRLAMDAGYDRQREDALLASIDWPNDGYRLFEIAALDPSSINGWLSLNGESNALFLSRAMWDALGGVEERFDAPGGGLVNLDTFRRAVEMPEAQLVVLLGEATFHQVHGGIATNADVEAFPTMLTKWSEQYQEIRGQRWMTPVSRGPRTLLGHLPRSALTHFVRAALKPVPSMLGSVQPPLGSSFDRSLWSVSPPDRPADAVTAQLVDLAQTEFRAGRYAAAAAVARLTRAHVPDEASPQRLLAHASPWSAGVRLPPDEQAATHTALGEAYRLLGRNENAVAEYRSALALDGNLRDAHLGLSRVRMPGDDYYTWLDRLQDALRPENYVEIGVDMGLTLALARPPTRVFGVDPEPSVTSPLRTETHIFTQTSDAFFSEGRLDALLAGRPVKLAFIDGLHGFEQCLRDFRNLEAYCDPTSVILLHDTVPLDEPTQRRKRETIFWTGDVWKTVLALRHYRPELDIFTIATAPTGLTVVTGLDPSSRVLAEAYDDAVRRFIDVPFTEVENRLEDAFNIVPNDWETVAARLRARGVL
jgi:tetratricopeptide (TPR) repeat protein